MSAYSDRVDLAKRTLQSAEGQSDNSAVQALTGAATALATLAVAEQLQIMNLQTRLAKLIDHDSEETDNPADLLRIIYAVELRINEGLGLA